MALSSTQADSATAPSWWFLVLAPLVAFALVFAAFGPALDGHFLQWDDTQGIAQNEHLRLRGWDGIAWRFTTTQMGHYQPLSWWSLSLDIDDAPPGELGDEVAARCHRTNLLLHALGAVAFALLAERLLRALFRSTSAPPSANALALAALFASLAWALHPLRAESVAWITERRDDLSGVPLLLSLYMYVLWADGRPVPGWGGGRGGFYCASLALLAISLLAKASGMVVPAVLVVLDFYPLRRSSFSARALGRSLLEKAPFFALGLGCAALAAWAQASEPDAMPSFAEHTLFERALQAAYGLCFYAWKSIVPTGLGALYELPKNLSLADARFAVSALAVASASVALFLLRRRAPGLVAAAITSTLFVAPVLGFAQAGPQLVADRYTYLYGLVIALALAALLLQWSRVVRWLPCALGVALLPLFVFATRAQAATWRDTESLWSNVLARDPEHVVGNLSLGNERARRAFSAGSAQEAARLLHEAEQLFTTGLAASDDPRFATRLALVHDALSKLEPDRAEEHARLAKEFSERAVQLAIATGRVKPETRLQHGIHLLEMDRVDEALKELEWYAEQRPDDPRGKHALEDARARNRLR